MRLPDLDWAEWFAIAVIAIVVIAIGWAVLDSRESRSDKVADREATSTTRTHPDVERFIDHEAGVVCWAFDSDSFAGGIHCLPLEQTRLRAEGQPTAMLGHPPVDRLCRAANAYWAGMTDETASEYDAALRAMREPTP